MRTIYGTVSLGFPGAEISFEFDVPDEATDEEIDQECWNWGSQYLESWWEED